MFRFIPNPPPPTPLNHPSYGGSLKPKSSPHFPPPFPLTPTPPYPYPNEADPPCPSRCRKRRCGRPPPKRWAGSALRGCRRRLGPAVLPRFCREHPSSKRCSFAFSIWFLFRFLVLVLLFLLFQGFCLGVHLIFQENPKPARHGFVGPRHLFWRCGWKKTPTLR